MTTQGTPTPVNVVEYVISDYGFDEETKKKMVGFTIRGLVPGNPFALSVLMFPEEQARRLYTDIMQCLREVKKMTPNGA